MYGVPYEMYEKYSIRRYGAHSASHRYVSMAAARYLNDSDLKMVTCHLGSGSSISAVNAGKCGTPAWALPAGRRADGHPLRRHRPQRRHLHGTEAGIPRPEMADYLNKKSGLLGISGVSSDMRDVTSAADAGNEARQTGYRDACVSDPRNMQVPTPPLWVGWTAWCLPAASANDNRVRASVCEHMGFLGISVDPAKNQQRTSDILDISGKAAA